MSALFSGSESTDADDDGGHSHTDERTDAPALGTVADLLRDAEGEPDQPVDEPSPKRHNIGDVKALAEALGVTPKQLYGELMIDVGGDEGPVPLGQLKDLVKDQQTVAREASQREAGLIEREAALVREQQMLGSVLHDLKGKISPEVARALQQRTEANEQRERGMMMRTMPEVVSSPQALHAFTESVAEALGEYGFQPHELAISDHRMLLVLRDFLRLKKAVKQAAVLERASVANPPNAAQSRRAGSGRGMKDMVQRARNGTEADKAIAVAALLKG